MIRLIRSGVEGHGVALTPQTKRHFRPMLVLIGVERSGARDARREFLRLLVTD